MIRGNLPRSAPTGESRFRRQATLADGPAPRGSLAGGTGVAAAQERPRRREATKQGGTTILECTAALVVAGLAILSATHATGAAASVVKHGRLVADTTSVARGLLERELGAPCAASLSCPPDYRCSIARTRIGAALDRVSASVTRIDGAASEELRTLAPPASCGS